MGQKSLIYASVLVFGLIFSSWLMRQTFDDQAMLNLQSADRPDAYMINAAYTSMDTTGNLHNKIFTPKMVHYPSDDTSTLESPHIILYNPGHTPWDVTANYGKSLSGTTQVYLWDNVKIHQPAGPNDHELTVLTPALTVQPDTQTAQTDQAVTINQPGAVVQSVGLKANLKNGQVELLSRARGTYATPSNP